MISLDSVAHVDYKGRLDPKSLLQYISFDYWVISDTGSTDGTQKVIKDYFKSKNINGELLVLFVFDSS